MRQPDWHHLLSLLTVLATVIGAIFWSIFRFFRELVAGMRETEVSYRIKENRCLNCGYRLIGNTSGTCPECGGRF